MIQANFDNRPIVPPDEYAENYCRNTIEALKRKRKVYCSHKSLQTKSKKQNRQTGKRLLELGEMSGVRHERWAPFKQL